MFICLNKILPLLTIVYVRVYVFGFEIGVPRYYYLFSSFYADESIRRGGEEVCNWCADHVYDSNNHNHVFVKRQTRCRDRTTILRHTEVNTVDGVSL
jgi:hypothetical protein